MIDRYTRPQMGQCWTPQARFQCLQDVELAVAKVQAQMGLIPGEAFGAIESKACFQLDRISEIEKETRHDVIAFVSNLAENVGPPYGRYIHYRLTSSDVLDTALGLQVKKASPLLLASVDRLLDSLMEQSLFHRHSLCAGRTHGMFAEPTTFGFKLAGFFAEFSRHKKRLQSAFRQMAIGKISGTLGTYSLLKPEVEQKVCELLGLEPETIATQVIPRDRHGELFSAFALLGGGLERLAVELRHLQRSEVGEVFEAFEKGQKGSSAMPHKKNPISSENITGCARLLRSYCLAAMENMALWHERDISHSSVERLIFPDAFILCDYACDRMARVITNMEVKEERMLKNMDLSQGKIFSSHLLVSMIHQGLSREEAYEKIQKVTQSLKPGEHLQKALQENPETREYFNRKTLSEIFSGKRHLTGGKEKILKEFLSGKEIRRVNYALFWSDFFYKRGFEKPWQED